MAYLRLTTTLPSGNKSSCYVFGDPDGLINIYKKARVSYFELGDLFRDYDEKNFRDELGKRLKLEGEELG